MGFLGTVRKITISLIALANVIVVVAMVVCAWAGHVSPASHPFCEVIALAFPIPLAVNLLFLVYWCVVSIKYAFIPLIGLLLCFNSVRNYFPVNITHPSEKCDIKVMSFNINNFGGFKAPDSNFTAIARYIVGSGADVVCLQETQNGKKSMQPVVKEMMGKVYPYTTTNKKAGHVQMSLYSKFPIRWAKDVPFESDPVMARMETKNLSTAYCLDMGSDTLLVFNCHLNSHGFDMSDKKEFKNFVDRKTDHIDERSYVTKISQSARLRALQADFIERTLRKHKGASIVLCGDFNSSPTSYAHNTIHKQLNDCYRMAGNGAGFSFSRYGMYVRIDHIFCSDDWKPLHCKIDKKFTVSDHLPVVCTLKKRPNT